MSATMPKAVQALKRTNAEFLELEALLFDLLLAMQLRPKKRPKQRAPAKAPRRRPRHPSGGLPGYLFSGKNTGGTG